jgi:hypothetical protein
MCGIIQLLGQTIEDLNYVNLVVEAEREISENQSSTSPNITSNTPATAAGTDGGTAYRITRGATGAIPIDLRNWLSSEVKMVSTLAVVFICHLLFRLSATLPTECPVHS